MSYDAEGEIQIPAVDFWEFVLKYVPDSAAEYLFGRPRIDYGDDCLCITFAASTTENHPASWSEPPKAKLEWSEATK